MPGNFLPQSTICPSGSSRPSVKNTHQLLHVELITKLYILTITKDNYITYFVIGLCAILCAIVNKQSQSDPIVFNLLVPREFQIWNGRIWGLATSAFIHIELFHILFNMWWLKDFGSLFEANLKKHQFILFLLSSAIASSSAQLLISGQTGIGFSGVVYALFGVLLASKTKDPRYAIIINKTTAIWLIGWMFLCIVMTHIAGWNIANAAHVAGFIYGYCIGQAFIMRKKVALYTTGLFACLVICIASVTYAPWLPAWKERNLYQEFKNMESQAEKGDAEAQYQYSLFFRDSESNFSKYLYWLKESVQQKHLPAMNEYAWVLVTDKRDYIRNKELGLKLAKECCELDRHEQSIYIDTLAAAYAANDQWEKAIELQMKAISSNKLKEHERGMKARLQLYQNKQTLFSSQSR